MERVQLIEVAGDERSQEQPLRLACATAVVDDITYLVIALAYYFVSYFITIYFNTALVVAVRRGEPFAEPLARRASRVLQGLERIANA
jgi:hypothetical protein